MYVVRRTFRNYGQMMAPGSVVEPAAIKRFKSRLKDGRIVEVSEQNFDKWNEYFKVRIGTPILVPTDTEEQKTEEQKSEEQKSEEQKTEEQKTEEQKSEEQKSEVPKVTPVVKVVSK